MAHHDFKFQMERIFDAPRARMWEAWTNEEQLKAWFGPKGCPVFHSKLDLREGGSYHYGMRTPDGGEMWGRWTFVEIKAPERLVTIVSFSDPTGQNVTRHPWNASWPLKTLSTIDFIDMGDKTKISIVWQAYEATDAEAQTFEDGKDSMHQGWGGTCEQLETYLATHK